MLHFIDKTPTARSAILFACLLQNRRTQIEFLVKWLNYPSDKNTWEPYSSQLNSFNAYTTLDIDLSQHHFATNMQMESQNVQ